MYKHLRLIFVPLTLKALLERSFLELRDRGQRLEELLPRRVSSEEQREVLGLLCKVHELEIGNAEMQSHALLKDNVIRQKNFVVQRFEQHRHLCDEIIQQQRRFIIGAYRHHTRLRDITNLRICHFPSALTQGLLLIIHVLRLFQSVTPCKRICIRGCTLQLAVELILRFLW